jgi:hypothetical protein
LKKQELQRSEEAVPKEADGRLGQVVAGEISKTGTKKLLFYGWPSVDIYNT